ncbi:ICL-domain-containing protein [Artomyces pyxidatus]|uniref:ICL-domain-containing protein n=1 Tax=Artomyces pyxidatus TaxID=48021 RepID=A0ACB8SIY8_9AGAM|nr:ICL-domain-containing protein [Artomyces pyxidatus]
MAKYLETVYVSGWQSSSTASSTNEPGPDLAGTSFPVTVLPLAHSSERRLPIQHGTQQGGTPFHGTAVS